jgi:hypothetical protein
MTDTDPRPPREEDYPPSRPGPKTLIGAGVVILVGFGIAYWPAISAFIHLPEIRSSMGL